MDISTLLSRHARYRPDKLALIIDDHRLTYREYNRNVNRLANAMLDMGVQKGDKIATLLPNCMELLETYWAVSKIGAVVVPLSTLLLGKGLKSLLDDSDAVMVITSSAFVDTLEQIRQELANIPSDRFILIDGNDTPGYRDYHDLTAAAGDLDPVGIDIDGDDMFNIVYSSGTTGQPKGIVHTHRIRSYYCNLGATAFRMTPESVFIHTGALVFNGAFVTLMPCLFLGATYILHRQFDAAEFIRTVAEEKVTHTIMVPAQIIAIMHHEDFAPEALSSLEMICNVGAPLHQEHKDELNRHLPGRIYDLYGLTEGFLTILDKNDFDAKPGSVGVPPPFYEMRITDEKRQEVPPGEVGEIVGRGPIMMSEYYKRPDLTREAVIDGWLYTGDMGYVDEDGFLYLVDRKKDMMISGGVNVYPKDIEEVVVRHPDVMEVAVFGIPSEKWGEAPVAAVTLVESGKAAPDEIRVWINERVGAKFQRIQHVVILDELPRNIAGKVLKRVMRDEFAEKLGGK
ncbi:MAG: AMP-binding protein [Deltaproteobacteria bacterium]|nr:AMP-binding protein [Deltaproteobacteria bacterium]MBW2285158.1 AMP-binding protein [Deltaproteobacteria bacterium]